MAQAVSEDRLKRFAGGHRHRAFGVKVQVALVAQHQPVVGVKKDKSVRQGLHSGYKARIRGGNIGPRRFQRRFVFFQLGDINSQPNTAPVRRAAVDRPEPAVANCPNMACVGALAKGINPVLDPRGLGVGSDDSGRLPCDMAEYLLDRLAGGQHWPCFGKEVAIAIVAQNQTFLGIENDKPVRQRIDRADQLRAGLIGRLVGLFQVTLAFQVMRHIRLNREIPR